MSTQIGCNMASWDSFRVQQGSCHDLEAMESGTDVIILVPNNGELQPAGAM